MIVLKISRFCKYIGFSAELRDACALHPYSSFELDIREGSSILLRIPMKEFSFHKKLLTNHYQIFLGWTI